MTAPVATDAGEAQRRLARLVAYQIPELEPSDFSKWAPEVADSIRQGGRAASSLSGREYLRLRDAARVAGRFTPLLDPAPPVEQIRSLLRWAAFADGDATTQTRVQGITQRMVLQSGRGTIARSMEADPRASGYVRVPSTTACAFCLMLSTRVFGKNGQIQGVYGSREQALFATGSRRGNRAEGEKYHDFCFVPDTVVSATRVELAHRRQYEGEVVTIRSTSGADMTVTPNHPVLTRTGWVSAGLVREGQDVVRRTAGYGQIVPGNVPDQDQMPSHIEDVWRARRVNGLSRVPSSAEDFHGDAQPWQGDVDVVRADGQFFDSVYPALDELARQLVLSRAGAAAVLFSLAAAGDAFFGAVGAGSAPDGGVRGGGDREALLVGHAAHPGGVRLRTGPRRNSVLCEPPDDHTPGCAVALAQREYGLPGLEQFDELNPWVGPDAAGGMVHGRKFDPPPVEGDSQGLGIAAKLGRDLLERLTGSTSFDRVVDVRRGHYSGHVYNLSTDEGWYDANGFIVSNCRCSSSPIFSTQTYEPPEHVRRAAEIYADSTGSVQGKAKLSAFRAALK